MNILRRRSQAAAAAAPVLATYARPNWIQRHRMLCILVLLGFAFFYSAAFTLIGRFMLMPFMTPLAILLGLVVWMLPENDRPPTRALERLTFAYIVALLCWPDYLAIALPGLPWITLLRLTGFPLVITLLLCVSVSPTFRAEMKDRLSAVPAIWKCVLAVTIIALFSIALSKNVSGSSSRFVVMLVNWTGAFFVGVYILSLPRRIEWLGYLLWGIAIYVTAIGFQEWRFSHVPWAGHIPSFLAIEDESVLKILAGSARAATGVYRVQSKFTTSSGLAEYLSMALPFILHVMVRTRRTGVRLAALASIPPIIWVLIKTDSRIGMVGLFLSLLFYALAWGAMRWRFDKGSLFGPAVTLAYPAIFTGFVIATFFVGRLRNSVWGTGATAASTQSRRMMYEMGIPMVLKNPQGHGLGMGGITLGFVNPAGTLTIDTYYLAVALELGVLGFFLYFGMFLVAIFQGAKTVWRAPTGDALYLVPVTIALTNFFVIKSVFSQLENHPLAFMLLGASVGLIWRARREEAARPAGPDAATSPATAPRPVPALPGRALPA